jgi:hypothetical protein
MAARPKNGTNGADRVRSHRRNVAQLCTRLDQLEDVTLGLVERFERLERAIMAAPTASILLGTSAEKRNSHDRLADH